MQEPKNKNSKNTNPENPNPKGSKIERVLGIYKRLRDKDSVNKAEMAYEYNVDERSIMRDIEDIRSFLISNADRYGGKQLSVVHSNNHNGYVLLEDKDTQLTNSELLALCKILLDSRAFPEKEMFNLLDKLLICGTTKENKVLMEELIRSEKYHYIEPRHKTNFIDTMWKIGQAIKDCNLIEIEYLRVSDHTLKRRVLRPLAIMFSEFYFYLAAIIDDEKVHERFDIINDSNPTIYRMDRVKTLRVLKEKFHIPYADRSEEGEFRKRIQFMYGGPLQKVTFKYTGCDIDAILDRLPTAEITGREGDAYLVKAEAFGKGLQMWLGSQTKTISDIKFDNYSN